MITPECFQHESKSTFFVVRFQCVASKQCFYHWFFRLVKQFFHQRRLLFNCVNIKIIQSINLGTNLLQSCDDVFHIRSSNLFGEADKRFHHSIPCLDNIKQLFGPLGVAVCSSVCR